MNMLARRRRTSRRAVTWTQSGQTFTNGDLVITYVLPAGVTDSDTANRPGGHGPGRLPPGPVDPAHLDLPAAGRSGRMRLTGEVTMVIN